MLEWRSYLHTNIDKKQMKGLFYGRNGGDKDTRK